MATSLLQMQPAALQLYEQLDYPTAGMSNRVLLKDGNCQYTLFCMAAGADISEHRANRNATVHTLEGNGQLTLDGREIDLRPGTFAVMPARTPHAIRATDNLAFLLILSEPAPSSPLSEGVAQ